MRDPIVSVLMPIYNTPITHLKEAINSILAQTFTDFEYLILNDSPDNMKLDKVLASYNDPRIKYVSNNENIGLEDSTNKLINMARGKYIAIFDHDDISLPERLQREVEYLDKNPKVGVVSAQFEVFGDKTWVSKNPLNDKDIKKKLATDSCVSHTTIMYRKSVLQKYNIRYEKKFFPAASYRVITRLALVTNLHNLPELLLKYRMDGNNTSIRYAEQRAIARQQIRKEYSEDIQINNVKKIFKFDIVERLDGLSVDNERQYYKAAKGSDTFFVKQDIHDFNHEFYMAKKMFDKSSKYFIEPIECYAGSSNFIVFKWTDGTSLDKYLEHKDVSTRERKNLLHDLYEIYKLLCEEGLVHRDIIPRNFLVTNERLFLIDFHFTVSYQQYEEYEYVQEDITQIDALGESFAAGVYKWDDAVSFTKIAHYILGNDHEGNYLSIQKICSNINDRVISPDVSVFSRNILRMKSQLLKQDKYICELETDIHDRDSTIAGLNDQLQAIKMSKSYMVGTALARPMRVAKKIIRKF